MPLAIVAIGAVAIGLVGIGLIYYSRPSSVSEAASPSEGDSHDRGGMRTATAAPTGPQPRRRSPKRLQIVLLGVSGLGILLVAVTALGRAGSGPPLGAAGWIVWGIVALGLLGTAGAVSYALFRRRQTLGSMLAEPPPRRDEMGLTCPYCSAALTPEEGLLRCGTCGSTLFRVPMASLPTPDGIPVVLERAKTLSVVPRNGKWAIETDGNTYTEPDEILDPALRSVVTKVVELVAPVGSSHSSLPAWGLDDVQERLEDRLARHPEFSARRIALETDARGFLRAKVDRQTFIRLEEIPDPALRGLLRETLQDFHANN